MLTGIQYPFGDSFIKPNFSLTSELWKKIECLYFFWNPVTAEMHEHDNTCDDSRKENYYLNLNDEPNKIYLAKILREIDNLRFQIPLRQSFSVSGVDYFLQTCKECFFSCRCYGGFRMVTRRNKKKLKR